MTRAEDTKDDIRRRLETARSRLFEAISGLTEEQMRRQPSPARWSVAQVMAHLPVWERHVLRQADSMREGAGRTAVFPSRAQREEAAGRARRLPPPGIVHDLVAARWETFSFLERLTKRELSGTRGHEAHGELRAGQILVAIAEYEEEQASRIQRLREELGLPLPGAASSFV